mgnify:CR=1 FL=1
MKEIKAGDIMIGNYVQVGSDVGKVLIINGQNEVKFDNIYLECSESFEWAEINKLKGIPLTDDILVKAGFIIGGYNLVEVTHPDYPRLFFVIIDDTASVGWNYNVSGTLKECEGSMIEIKYLHQLQNLFKSLTGNDLKIEV